MDRWEGGDYARPIILFIHYKFWLLCQPKVSVPLTYNGRNCGSCDNLKTARYFLIKPNKWIDGKREIMHILLFCQSDQNFGCYGNLKFPLAYNGEKVDPAIT